MTITEFDNEHANDNNLRFNRIANALTSQKSKWN